MGTWRGRLHAVIKWSRHLTAIPPLSFRMGEKLALLKLACAGKFRDKAIA